MNIDYTPDGYLGDPIIRIFGTEPKPIIELALKLHQLCDSKIDSVKIHELDGFASQGCRLSIRSGPEDGLIESPDNSLDFSWELTKYSIGIIEELLVALGEPDGLGCNQWLCGKEARFDLPTSGIGLLISRDSCGSW
jgi:hypothetical protein